MAERDGFWFVYRSHYEGPLSKRVRRLDGTSILDWFRELIRAARDAEEPCDLGEAALGGHVYGFGGFLVRAKEERFALPRSHAALAALVKRHVFENEFASDAHTLRVLADDDEVALAYYFFDDEAERRHPDRVTYLLRDEPRLPDGAAEGGFAPPVRPMVLLPAGGGEGATYV
jgi:hypothetical protein